MKMVKTKTTVLAYVYVSNDTSSVSAWCLHRAQAMLSSEQYFCKNIFFSDTQDILNIRRVIHGPANSTHYAATSAFSTNSLRRRHSLQYITWPCSPLKKPRLRRKFGPALQRLTSYCPRGPLWIVDPEKVFLANEIIPHRLCQAHEFRGIII